MLVWSRLSGTPDPAACGERAPGVPDRTPAHAETPARCRPNPLRWPLQRPSGHRRHVGGIAAVADRLPVQEALDLEHVVPGAFGDREQRAHLRDLLHLL